MWAELQCKYSSFGIIKDEDRILLGAVIDEEIESISCVSNHKGRPEILNHLMSELVYLEPKKYKYHQLIFETYTLLNM